MKHRDAMDCREVEAQLDDLADGLLPRARQRRLRDHLAGCAACRAAAAELDELLAAAGALPRAIEPATDLWPRIAARLRPRRLAARVGLLRSARHWLDLGWQGWAWQAAAAVIFMALGAVLSPVLIAPPPPVGSHGVAAAVSLRAAAWESQLTALEAGFLRAREDLWLAAWRGRRSLPPETDEVVERNLLIIDKAIRELRQALAADPGNRSLEGMLLATHRREIDLLRRLARDADAI